MKALLRMAVVWNIPVACNRSTADFMVSSTIMDNKYERIIPDYENFRKLGIGRTIDQQLYLVNNYIWLFDN